MSSGSSSSQVSGIVIAGDWIARPGEAGGQWADVAYIDLMGGGP